LKAVVQRVLNASVSVDDGEVSAIARGMVVLLGIEKGDSQADLTALAERLPRLRFFADDGGKMNLSLSDIGGEVLAVSQFTLAADLSRGLRPSFDSAMELGEARGMFDDFIKALRGQGVDVKEGVFGAHMHVELINDGPVTFVLEGARK
jgi:D-tyrosyl-tRNA(Tyr) deacylase